MLWCKCNRPPSTVLSSQRKREAVTHEPTVTSGIDRVTTRELLLAQRRQVASRDEQEPHCLWLFIGVTETRNEQEVVHHKVSGGTRRQSERRIRRTSRCARHPLSESPIHQRCILCRICMSHCPGRAFLRGKHTGRDPTGTKSTSAPHFTPPDSVNTEKSHHTRIFQHLVLVQEDVSDGHQWNTRVISPEERQGDQPTWPPSRTRAVNTCSLETEMRASNTAG